MKVLVVGLNGIGLDPTTPGKARVLLDEGKADVYQMNPFTIRLKYKTGSATQQTCLGEDTGGQHIGFAVTNDNGDVKLKTDVELRTSMEKRELIEKRSSYRKDRRYRKTRYRHPKTKHQRKRVYSEKLNKKGHHWRTLKQKDRPQMMSYGRPKGWLPPSIQSKVDHHIDWTNRFLRALPLNTKCIIEVARFDIQRLKNPDIKGIEYQRGRMYDYENVRAYVLAKFEYTCPVCGHKFDSEHKPKMHHIEYRSKGATNNPDAYAPVCEKCHTPENHLPDGALDRLRKACREKHCNEPEFMSILRLRMFEAFPDAEFTYGNITAADRKVLGISKTHANDAVVISMKGRTDTKVNDVSETVMIRQVRRNKRSLHEARPRKGKSKPNTESERNNKNVRCVNGYHIYDTVEFEGRKGYISGFTGTSAYVVDIKGKYIIRTGKTYKQIPLSMLRHLAVRTNNYISEVTVN